MQLKIRAEALALAAAMAVAGLAAADQAKKPAESAQKPAEQASPMDDKAMMEAWAKVATPGEAHRWLEPVVGTWDAKITMWMAPGAPPQESTGTSENKWVLGGRFVEQRHEGNFMGQPFSGLGYTGYDNYKKKYVGTWMDTMGTMIMVSEGDADSTGKTLSMTSSIDDIMTGKAASIRSEIKIVDPDHHVMEMWGPDPTGKQFKTMEIRYTRKK
jgi:uncharacterized protein DUF1579